MNFAKKKVVSRGFSFWFALFATLPAAVGAQVRSAQADSVRIIGWAVSGNTLLTNAAVQTALGAPPNSAQLSDFEAAAQRLQRAYREAGYGAVVVGVPPQTVSDGRVRLEVVEGHLAQTLVTGNKAFSRENVLRSLPALRTGETPRLDRLDRELLMANDNPAKSARVVFQPGAQRGDVEALVVVDEQPPRRWQVTLDNTGTPGTGRLRSSVFYQDANVGDSDTVVGLRVGTSPTHPSQVAVLSGTVRVPLYPQGMSLEGSLVASSTRAATNATPAGELRFKGKGYSAGARAVWSLPSLGVGKSQAFAGVDVRTYRNDCSLGDFGSEGCGPAAVSVNVVPLAVGWSWQLPARASVSVQAIGNLPIGEAGNDDRFAASRPGASSRYRLLRLSAQGSEPISATRQFSWRTDAQYSRKPLVSAEQFGAGGAATVRGYDERALSGDSGLISSLEWREAPEGIGLPEGTVLSLFSDAARLWNRGGAPCAAGRTSCSLWSVGAGASVRYGSSILLHVDLARAGRSAATTNAGDWRLHAGLTWNL